MPALLDAITTITLQPGDTVVVLGAAPYNVRVGRERYELPVGGFVVSEIRPCDGTFGDNEVGPCFGFVVSMHVTDGHWLVRTMSYGVLFEDRGWTEGDGTYTGSVEQMEACTDPNDPGDSADYSDGAASLGLDQWSRQITGATDYAYDHLPSDDEPPLECAEYLRILAVAGQA